MGVIRPRSIEVHIDEIALHGFQAADRHEIGDAVQVELTGLLATEEVAQSINRSKSIERLDGGSIMPRALDPRHLGEGIAQSVSEGLRGWAQ
jgi:hypothetical protein